MNQITKSIPKKDHDEKIQGRALYVADLPTDDLYFGKVLRSEKAKAKFKVELPAMPANYTYIDVNDVPVNSVHMVQDDTPVFAGETVEYIGDAIGMIVGPEEEVVASLLANTKVIYEELPAVLNFDEATETLFEVGYVKGDSQHAFEEADDIYEEVFRTGYQEHVYLETQGMIATPKGEIIEVRGSIQCPYYVHRAVAQVLDEQPANVEVLQDVMGGGFGGKEGYPSILAAQVAVAARKINHAVRVIFDRSEDIEATSKRHPSRVRYRVAMKNDKITGMDIDVAYNAGAYTTLSLVVLQRGIIGSTGVYDVPNLTVNGHSYKTNTVPNGAFRGFGGPQVFFGVEMMMEHIAKKRQEDPLDFKKRHMVVKGNQTSTGGEYHFDVPLPAMIEAIEKESNYHQKYEAYKKQTGRYRKGIGMSLFFHGAGFTGAGERDLIKAVVRLHKFPDGSVEVLTAGTDMGQGLKTTFAKIVANELKIPIDQVIVNNPNTKYVPDSGPTAASRSLMIVGELLRRAAIQLRETWKDGEEQTTEEHYKEPDFIIPFNPQTFEGDAYPTYAWGVNAIEVEVDTVTGYTKVVGAYGSFDAGTPIDENIVIGQMEGGFLQSIGYASMEYIMTDQTGRFRNNSFSDYIIPTAMDVPVMKCLLYVDPYPLGPYGAKGAGELPTVGAPAAYLSAMEQALGDVSLHHIPFTSEDTMTILQGGNDE